MISLKRSITDHERSQCLSAQVQDLLISTLESVRQYAVETDRDTVEGFRNHLGAIIKRVRACVDSQETDSLNQTRTDIRCQLRDYRDRATRYIEHLRLELKNTGTALNELLSSCQADTGSEQMLKEQVKQIRGLESARDLEDVRISARRIATAVAQCAEQIKREKDSVILQLRDEIRTLHKAMEQAERAAKADEITGCYNRAEMERLIRREMVGKRSFTVVHVWLRNFEQLRGFTPVGIMDQLAISFSKRAVSIAKGTALGRWESDVFCLIAENGAAKELSSDVMRRCSGTYACNQGDGSVTLNLQLTATLFAPPPGSDVEAVFKKIQNLKAV